MKPSARRKARQLATQAIYNWQMTGNDSQRIIEQFLIDLDTKNADLEYFRALLNGVLDNLEPIDSALTPLVSRPLDDVDQVDKAILRLAAFELLRRNDVPYKVVINEAIELAKTFATDESHKFINGVLDRLVIEHNLKA